MSVYNAYETLGVPRSASPSTIKRAYRHRSLRLHPDKHPAGRQRAEAEQAFKQLSAAYAILNDPVSRAVHDRALEDDAFVNVPVSDPFSNQAFRQQFANGFSRKFREEGFAVDTDTIFDSLFGERRENFTFDEHDAEEDASTNSYATSKPPDREIELALTLEELHTGCVKKRRLYRIARHPETGVLKKVPVLLRIDINPGYRPGDKVRFKDAGDEASDRPPPDVVFVISQKPHPRFTRHCDDIHIRIPISLADALTGSLVIVEGLEKENIELKLDNVVTPDSVRHVKGQGMSRRSQPSQRGDMVISFNVSFPDKLLPAERALLRDAFSKISNPSKSDFLFPSIRRSASHFMNRNSTIQQEESPSRNSQPNNINKKNSNRKSNNSNHQQTPQAPPASPTVPMSPASKISSQNSTPSSMKRAISLSNTEIDQTPELQQQHPTTTTASTKPRPKVRFGTFFR